MEMRVDRVVLWGTVAIVTAGCSRFPDPPDKPELNPGEAGRLAIEAYDANGNGKIAAEEIEKSPGLMEAIETMDNDGDGALTADEISTRVQEWLDESTAVFTQATEVTLDGEPLAGATVTYVPEEFLGAGVQETSGVTDETGSAYPQGQDAKYPGLYAGVYRIRISKIVDGKETIPARYNTETVLGKEIAFDAPSTHALLVFELTSN